ncbi:uncharacterized protein LOC144664624 [Oculina patagonica]
MLAFFGLFVFQVMQVEANNWQGSDDLYIKMSITSQQPLIPGHMATLHVECRDTSINRKEIEALTMAFSLPYFMVYQYENTISGSIEPSSVRNNTGQPILQFSSLKPSDVISLDIKLLVMRQDRVPDGKESTSVGHVDVSYQRGSDGCSQTFNTYRNIEILVYNPDCEKFGPLGMTDGSIKESQLSVSSIFQTSFDRAGNGPYRTGLHRKEYWAPAVGLPSHDRRQYIQVDFKSLVDVKMISAQGHPDTKAPINSLQITTSDDGYRWKDYSNKNLKFYVTTGASGNALLTALLKMPLTTQWLRISPRFSERLIGFRFEVYGCLSEKQLFSFEDPPLGMESGEIADNQVSSTSEMGERSIAANARLNLQSAGAAWCSKAVSGKWEWLAVYLGTSHVVSAVSTQCRYPIYADGKALNCVTSYRLKYTPTDPDDWATYTENGISKDFLGNFQRQTMVKHHLIKPIQTKKIIFIPKSKISNYYCMRVELYGRKTVVKGQESRMVFPEPRSTTNYAMIENAIGSELSQFTVCFFVKMVLSNPTSRKCVFSYASEHTNDILICIFRDEVKFLVGDKSRKKAIHSLTDGSWHHVCIAWENAQGEWKIYKNGQLAVQGDALNRKHTVKPGGVVVLGQDQHFIGGGFEINQAFTGELAEVNLWDMVLSAADIAAQYRNCYIPEGSVLQWSQFKLVGEVEIKKYSCTLTTDRPLIYSRAFLVDAQFNRLFVCNTEKSRKKSHCYVTTDGKTWIALNSKLLTIHGLDEAGKLHGVYLNGKAFISCKHNGEGACNVGPPETWYQARDQAGTMTAIEVPIIAETGLDTTDFPSSPLIRMDSKGRSWGASARGIHLSLQSSPLVWKLVLTWRDYDFDECASSKCKNGGTCVIVEYGFVCICLAGWTGFQCETNVDECASNPCKNGATCTDQHLSYICTCVDGYTGTFCETDINECESGPCVNGGKCTDKLNSYTCSCARGYKGVNCETDIDECLTSPCNSGECNNRPGSYSCTCHPGWLGKHCDDIDECLESPCRSGTCQNQPGGYSCVCPVEWQGNNCENYVESCYNNAVGVANPSSIQDNQMTASSQFDDRHLPSYGRLNNARGGGWCAEQANETNDWLQIDFNRTVEVCAVATQGDNDGIEEWVTDFKLSFSSDGGNWTTYRDANDTEMEFHRAGNSATVDQHKLPVPASARYIRFHPTKQHVWNCLRVEVYGINDPCHHYQLLDEPNRKRNFIDVVGFSPSCDRYLIPESKTWYRFGDIAGSQMATSCVDKYRCHTHAPGWLNGDHPSVAQGVVNMKVCFHWSESCCHFHAFISVKNCGSFYSYGLVKAPQCSLRYCGEA